MVAPSCDGTTAGRQIPNRYRLTANEYAVSARTLKLTAATAFAALSAPLSVSQPPNGSYLVLSRCTLQVRQAARRVCEVRRACTRSASPSSSSPAACAARCACNSGWKNQDNQAELQSTRFDVADARIHAEVRTRIGADARCASAREAEV
eukprot:6201528-Pleurochrysis_carterae.AAC.2